MEKQEKQKRIEIGVALVGFFIATVGFLYWKGTLTSGFHLIDDKDLFACENLIQNEGIFEAFITLLRNDFQIGRFRVLYCLLRIVATFILGTNYFYWSVYKGIEIWGAAVCLYFFARNLKFHKSYAVAFVGIVLVGAQSAAWWKLGTQENTGILLLAVTLLLLSVSRENMEHKRCYYVGLGIMTILTASIKESFAAFLPALLLIQLWIELDKMDAVQFKDIWKVMKSNRGYILFTCFITLLMGIGILSGASSKKMGIGNIEVKQKLLNMWFTVNGGTLGIYVQFAAIFLLLVIMVLCITHTWKKYYVSFAIGASIGLYVTATQLFIHANTQLYERYIFPWIVGYAFCNVMVMGSVFRKENQAKWIYLAGLLWLLLNRYPIMEYNAEAFAKDGNAVGAFLYDIQEKTVSESKIVAMMPDTFLEWNFATCIWLENNGRENVYAANFDDMQSYSSLKNQEISEFYDYSDVQVLVTMDDGGKNMIEGLDVNWEEYEKRTYEGLYTYAVYFKR